MNAPRWISLALAACLLLPASLAAKEPERFYYLAVPSAPAKCLFFSCLQFDPTGKRVAAPGKKGPFFTLWRSGYWDEKNPHTAAKDFDDWHKALELRAQKTLAEKKEMSLIPSPIVEFFVAVETVRAAALNQPLVVEPLFQSQGFIGWENGRHLNALVTPDTLGPKERSKALLRAMGAPEKEQDQDPAQWMKTLLTNLGVKVQSVRYWPEYNIFLFEGDGEFKDLVEVLFNAF